MDFRSPYSPHGVRRAREHLINLMSSTNGKLMNSIRYKTGQYRNSCPVKPHNNDWHISALISQDSDPTRPYHGEQFDRHLNFPNMQMGFPEGRNNIDFSLTRQYSIPDEQHHRGHHQLSVNKQHNMTITGEQSLNPHKTDSPSFDGQQFGGQSSSAEKRHIQSVENNNVKRRRINSDQSDDSSDDHGIQSDDFSDEQGSQLDDFQNNDGMKSLSEKTEESLEGPSNNPNKRPHSSIAYIEDLHDQLRDSIKQFKGEIGDSQFSGHTDGHKINYPTSTSLLCDLCDFMTPPRIPYDESHQLMYDHLNQQRHNSASLVKTRFINGKNTMVSVIGKNYKAIPTEPHIVKTNSIVPMCPYPDCLTFHATKWQCATHFNLFHNKSVADCYGVGKVLERKTVRISSDTVCTVCHKYYDSIKQLNQHERITSHMPFDKPLSNQRWIYFCPYCKTMSSKYFQVKSHVMHEHKKVDLAMDIVLIELPDKYLTLPPVENKPIGIEVQQEISALLEMIKVPQCSKRKHHKKILNQRISEMKKMRKACAKK